MIPVQLKLGLLGFTQFICDRQLCSLREYNERRWFAINQSSIHYSYPIPVVIGAAAAENSVYILRPVHTCFRNRLFCFWSTYDAVPYRTLPQNRPEQKQNRSKWKQNRRFQKQSRLFRKL